VTVTLPETRYARNNGLHVAYQLVGDGPVDIVLLTQWFSNIDSQWDVPPLAAFIRRLARFGRVLTFDKRGTGLSDPVPGVGTAVHRRVDGRSSHRHG
jgi:pimeloyl-ACP methyl ester carboxylesterase